MKKINLLLYESCKVDVKVDAEKVRRNVFSRTDWMLMLDGVKWNTRNDLASNLATPLRFDATGVSFYVWDDFAAIVGVAGVDLERVSSRYHSPRETKMLLF